MIRMPTWLLDALISGVPANAAAENIKQANADNAVEVFVKIIKFCFGVTS
jgi:hypothetical protein